jgi:hypothetical protein
LSECEFLIRPERILGGLEHFACGAGRLSVAGRVLGANPDLPATYLLVGGFTEVFLLNVVRSTTLTPAGASDINSSFA